MTFRSAIIPCAGRGTRMRQRNGDGPKELLRVGGRTLLAHTVLEARRAGLDHIVLVASADKRRALEAEARRLEADEAAGAAITVVVQRAPAGLADALRVGAAAIPGEPFAALLPDNLFDPPGAILPVLDAARATGRHAVLIARLTRAGARTKGGSGLASIVPHPAGAVLVTGVTPKQGRERFDLGAEEDAHVAIGRYAFLPEVLEAIAEVERDLPAGAELDDVPVLGLLAGRGRLAGAMLEGRLFDAGNPDGFEEAVRYFGP